MRFVDEATTLLAGWSEMLSPMGLLDGLGIALREALKDQPKQAALSVAPLRGLTAREELKAEGGGHISADQARRFLANVSKTTVLDRYRKGRVLAFKEGRAFRFPFWQFTPGGGLLPSLEGVLGVLHASPLFNDGARVIFFLPLRG